MAAAPALGMASPVHLPLEGIRVAITGANGTLGRAVAIEAAAQGAILALVDRELPLQPATGLSNATYFAADLTNATQARHYFDRVGPIEVLFNIAGGFDMGRPVHATTEREWEAMYALNVQTLLNSVRNVVPAMLQRGGGRIVNVGAASARSGLPLMSAYASSKATVGCITESMAAELRQHGINVNCVLPGVIDTPANRAAMPAADPSVWVPASDLAQVICFLASNAASSIHGASIPVLNRS